MCSECLALYMQVLELRMDFKPPALHMWTFPPQLKQTNGSQQAPQDPSVQCGAGDAQGGGSGCSFNQLLDVLLSVSLGWTPARSFSACFAWRSPSLLHRCGKSHSVLFSRMYVWFSNMVCANSALVLLIHQLNSFCYLPHLINHCFVYM